MISQVIPASVNVNGSKFTVDDNTVSIVDKIVDLFKNAPTSNLIIFAIVVFLMIFVIRSIITKNMKNNEKLALNIDGLGSMLDSLNKTLNNMQIIMYSSKTSSDERNNNYQRSIDDINDKIDNIARSNDLILKEFAVFSATRCNPIVREVKINETSKEGNG